MAQRLTALLALRFRHMRLPIEVTSPSTRTEIQPGIWLDSRSVVWLETGRLLVVADLHWGYAASHRARGNLLPVWGDRELEDRLNALVRDYAPAEMIWLGDVVHAAEGAGAVQEYLRRSTVPIQVLAGNHDRRWPGAIERTAQRGRFYFHHGDVERPAPAGCLSLIGHHHPAVNWSDGAGGNVRLPVLVASENRLVLPAFSPWAAGADCTPLLTPGSTIWAISPTRIFAFAPAHRLSAAV